MSRELKFRRAHFKDEAKTQFSHFSYWGKGINRSEFASPSFNNGAIYFEDQQFTGVSDKNEKEIYEGDIVTFMDSEDKSTESGYDWNDIQLKGQFEWSDERMGWHLTNRDSIEMDEIEFQEVEVIGNIYETSNLLTTK